MTPTLTGLGERVHLAHREVDLQTHITDIANVLAFEELEHVVLVGHSYGGMVITRVADRVQLRVARLIYLDGLVPHDGEAAIDIVGPQVRQELERQVRSDGDGWLIPVQCGEHDGRTLNAPHPFKTWTQSVPRTVGSIQFPGSREFRRNPKECRAAYEERRDEMILPAARAT